MTAALYLAWLLLRLKGGPVRPGSPVDSPKLRAKKA
jgi:hypothetical protein